MNHSRFKLLASIPSRDLLELIFHRDNMEKALNRSFDAIPPMQFYRNMQLLSRGQELRDHDRNNKWSRLTPVLSSRASIRCNNNNDNDDNNNNVYEAVLLVLRYLHKVRKCFMRTRHILFIYMYI